VYRPRIILQKKVEVLFSLPLDGGVMGDNIMKGICGTRYQIFITGADLNVCPD
jgi:hypothetical protein